MTDPGDDPLDPLDSFAETLDRSAHALIAQAFSGLSPLTIAQSFTDWGLHLASSPGTRTKLAAKAVRKTMRLAHYAAERSTDPAAEPAIEPLPQDHRFADPAWKQHPYDLISQAFLLQQQWWHVATTGMAGVSRHHEMVMEFATRQLLDMAAPTNFIASNPVLQARIVETGGRCLLDGAGHWLEDAGRLMSGAPAVGADAYPVGGKVAVTPGEVVFRNELIELIQYAPATGEVRPEPILIVPAWIMKYYILDLSPENSLVRWLAGQGFTVFMISWRNPDATFRDFGMEDYRRLGPEAALDAVTAITGAAKVHAAGYCLGGTLLALTAASLARDGDERLASLTLFAAQTDFTEPGELALFIDEAQLNLLDSMMWKKGYLDSGNMGSAFQLLRSNDLVWSHILSTYLMGEREPMNDLMAWNADGTRMPYAMHSQYLRQLFLNNDLADGRYRTDGRPVSLSALRMPLFMVGTERDHVAPWRSVHKLHMLTGAEIRFLLASGGHNAGIVSEPGHDHRHYSVATRAADEPAPTPDEWLATAERHEGSWWPEWGAWLAAHSSAPAAPPPLGNSDAGYPPLAPAPGEYVLQR
ncbi:Poly-beta-hydroxybutyrate polymerase [Novosphingobium lubricantis]